MGNSSTVASTHCVIGPNIEAENRNRNIMFVGVKVRFGVRFSVPWEIRV